MPNDRMNHSPEFGNPPVVEVVCGAVFQNADKRLLAPHVGLFWEAIQDEYPYLDEAPALNWTPVGTPHQMEIDIGSRLPRTWMLSEDGCNLVQLQRDRLLYNWKREDTDLDYPRFSHIFANFKKYVSILESVTESSNLGKLQFKEFELQYVNHIGPWNGLGKYKLCEILQGLQENNIDECFLPEPNAFQWNRRYDLPDENGRLEVIAQSAVKSSTGEPILRLDLRARGIDSKETTACIDDWFNLAHEWITRGFCDITKTQIQTKEWGRQA